MNYEEAIDYIHSTYKFGSKLGLDNIRHLLKLMGNPQSELRFIHVAGTNGKGSTSAFINEVLIEEGYSVGLFTSPYLEVFNERIRLNGNCIENADLATSTELVSKMVEKMLAQGLPHPTEFEIVTAVAMDFYKRQKADFVILEVGMGGRLDSTNVIERPLISVITPIAMDHTDYLGDTIEKIAGEKAGIIKKKSLVVSAPQQPEVLEVIRKTADGLRASLLVANLDEIQIKQGTIEGTVFDAVFDDERFDDLEIHLAGNHQVMNAMLALTALKAMKDRLNMVIRRESIYKGFKETRWAGRLEVLKSNPLILIDGAHNVHGAKSLSCALNQYLPGRKVVGLIGVLSDKDFGGILDELVPCLDRAIATVPDSPRSLAAEALAEELNGRGLSAKAVPEIEKALHAALEELGPDEVLVSFGSLYLIGQVRTLVQSMK